MTSSLQNISALASASVPAPKIEVSADVKKAAAGFEAFFLRQMMEDMRSASLGDDIFGSQATQNFQEMADAQLADNLSKSGQFGIAAMLEKQFAAAAGLAGANERSADPGPAKESGDAPPGENRKE